MKKRTKHLLYMLLAIILCVIIICFGLNISGSMKEEKVLFSTMSQEKSLSFCSKLGTNPICDWGIRDRDSVGEKMLDVELSRSYWKIKNTDSVYMYADSSDYEWCLITNNLTQLPSLSKNKISRIEIADSMSRNNFYFADVFTWQNIQIYKLDLDAEETQEISDIIINNLNNPKASLDRISFDEAEQYRQFYIRFYFETFDEIFYSPSDCRLVNNNGIWSVLIYDNASNQYAVIDISKKTANKLNQIRLFPQVEYNATWHG